MPFDDKEFMKDPKQWPLWPLLPVKRHRDKSGSEVPGGLECCVMWAEVKPRIFKVSYMMLVMEHRGKKVTDFQTYEYNTWEELIADGWIVD